MALKSGLGFFCFGNRSAIFWHLKMGTFAQSARFQVPKNALLCQNNVLSTFFTFSFQALGKNCQDNFVDFILLWLWSSIWDQHCGGFQLPRLLAAELLGTGMVSEQDELQLHTMQCVQSMHCNALIEPQTAATEYYPSRYLRTSIRTCGIQNNSQTR